MNINTTVCATGHRPKDLPGGYDGNKDLEHLIDDIVSTFVDVGYMSFISGGAIGVDQYFANSVLIQRAFNPWIDLVIARPFPSQASNWPTATQQRFAKLCDAADEVIDVSPDPYTPAKMQIRNQWMLDHSGLVFAVWTGKRNGGTWNCIQSALKLGRRIYWLNPATMEINPNLTMEDLQ